jgi:23S rRNA pseudouridine2605 synthase
MSSGEPKPLLKYLAHCGVASRRKSAQLIEQGLVSVNNKTETNPFLPITSDDVVRHEGKIVKPERLVYLLLNKPKDYITACSDERERKTVMDLITDAGKCRLYPIGRLDRMTTGLLLFTNDGNLAQKLSHPSSEISKTYRALLDKPLEHEDKYKLKKGFKLQDGFMKVDACSYKKKDKRDVTVQVHSGRYRIIRRLFKKLGYMVRKLDRVNYAGLSLGDLPRGRWRFLTKEEIAWLKKLVS